MPNWTYNTISANPTTIQQMQKKYFNEKGHFDFNRLIPMPSELNVARDSNNETDMYCFLSEKLTIPLQEVRQNPMSSLIYNVFSTDWLKEIKERVEKMQAMPDKDFNMDEAYERGKVLVSNFQNYGATTWYDWCEGHWGTKWNACETQVGETEIVFDTAWCAPIPIFKAICKDFPNDKISFYCVYEEGFTDTYENYRGKLELTNAESEGEF